LQIYQLFFTTNSEPFVVEGSLTENCSIFCKFRRATSLFCTKFRCKGSFFQGQVNLVVSTRSRSSSFPSTNNRTVELLIWILLDWSWMTAGLGSPFTSPHLFWTYSSQDVRNSWFRKRNLKWERNCGEPWMLRLAFGIIFRARHKLQSKRG